MVVHSSDGTKLGKIVECRADGFVVEKGIFFPRLSQLHYDDVSELRGGDVFLRYEKGYLAKESSWAMRGEEVIRTREPAMLDERRPATNIGERAAAAKDAIAARLGAKGETIRDSEEELRVPLAEEELLTEKRVRDLGEVRVHKRVVVTQKQVTVPVMHEEVVVERIALDASASREPTEATFVESTVKIPLHEEIVDISKRAVFREEVRVKRLAHTEDRTTTTDLRREELDVEEPTLLREKYRRSA